LRTKKQRPPFISDRVSAKAPSGEFFIDRSIEELAAIQRIPPLHDPMVLYGGIPEEEDLEKFLEDMYCSRREQAD
jgi:hypothetical protein